MYHSACVGSGLHVSLNPAKFHKSYSAQLARKQKHVSLKKHLYFWKNVGVDWMVIQYHYYLHIRRQNNFVWNDLVHFNSH